MINNSKTRLSKSSRLFSYLVSLPVIFLLVLVFFHQDIDFTQDLGRHLLIGKIIVQQKHIPSTNLFSYTYPDFPFFNHHWGSEVIFYLLHNCCGINGLTVLKTIVSAGAILLIFFYNKKKFKELPLLATSFLIINLYRWRTFLRPEIFGYLLFAVFLLLLYTEKEKSHKFIWLLPVLVFLWVNLHISFVFGVLAYVLFIIDALLRQKFTKKYFWILILLIPALILNPNGLFGALYPLDIFTNYGYSVFENQPFLFISGLVMNLPMILFIILFSLLVFSLPFMLFKKKYFELFICLVTAVMTLVSIRHAPFFALAFFYPLGLFFQCGYQKLHDITDKHLFLRFKVCEIILISGILILYTGFSYDLLSNNYQQRNWMMYKIGFGAVTGAEKMVDFFQKNKLPGNIWNNFDIGSYLIYRLYPDQRVFVDGRPEAYPAGFFQTVYIPMQQEEEIFANITDKYQIKTILYSHTDQTPWGEKFLSKISKNEKWKLVYFDDFGVIFTRANLAEELYLDNQEKIDNYSHKLLILQNDVVDLIRLSRFFSLIGQKNLAAQALMKSTGSKF